MKRLFHIMYVLLFYFSLIRYCWNSAWVGIQEQLIDTHKERYGMFSALLSFVLFSEHWHNSTQNIWSFQLLFVFQLRIFTRLSSFFLLGLYPFLTFLHPSLHYHDECNISFYIFNYGAITSLLCFLLWPYQVSTLASRYPQIFFYLSALGRLAHDQCPEWRDIW